MSYKGKSKEVLLKALEELQREKDYLKQLYDKDIGKLKQAEVKIMKAMEKAIESDRLKTAFLSNITHEIRTPMNAIIGYIDLLTEEEIEGYPKEKIIQIIKDSSNQLLLLINDIIDFSKIEASSSASNLQPASMTKIFDKVFEMFNLAAGKKGIELKMQVSLPDENVKIITDEGKLRQVLINLVSNAIKFTDSGSVNFECSINKFNEKELLFSVKDTGIGIRPEEHALVFDRFRQSDSIDTVKYGGTGLGLAISKVFIEMLGGKIWIDSALGEGCTFYFTIPYVVESAQAEIKGAKKTFEVRDTFHWQGKTILLAEDNEMNFQMYETILRKTGVVIIRALDGQEAIDKLKDHPEIELILMDIKMPVMDGLAATREIRKFNPTIPIIAQTAFVQDEDRSKAMAAGCNDYHVKPVNMSLLFTTIDNFM